MPELPKYPIYIPTKGRWETPFTIRAFQKDEVPIHVVIEESELENYEKHCSSPTTTFLTLPFSNAGSVIPSRNWIMEHSIEHYGSARHWQFDDNQDKFLRYYKGRSIPIQSHIALRMVEDFTDRYKNIAVSGFDYEMFVVRGKQTKPFTRNCRVYSASLHNNSAPFRWRGKYNEDVDWCLQALSTGWWSTILFRAVHIRKRATMTLKGGNTDELYQDDGRNYMSRSLERLWPGVVKTKRRFGRPQHVVSHSWGHFDNPFIPADDPQPIPEYAMKIEGTPESKSLRNALDL
jgi:hypothetical protein